MSRGRIDPGPGGAYSCPWTTTTRCACERQRNRAIIFRIEESLWSTIVMFLTFVFLPQMHLERSVQCSAYPLYPRPE